MEPGTRSEKAPLSLFKVFFDNSFFSYFFAVILSKSAHTGTEEVVQSLTTSNRYTKKANSKAHYLRFNLKIGLLEDVLEMWIKFGCN